MKTTYLHICGAILFTMLFLLPSGALSAGTVKPTTLALAQDETGQLFGATSELENLNPDKAGKYGPQLMFDGSNTTCWSEGTAGSGKGEAVFLSVPEGASALAIRNGYLKTPELFKKNNRIKTFKVTPYLGVYNFDLSKGGDKVYDMTPLAPAQTLSLKDSPEEQTLNVPFSWDVLKKKREEFLAMSPAPGTRVQQRLMGDRSGGIRQTPDQDIPIITEAYFIKLEIAGVYPGNRYDDTCVTEIRFIEP